MWYLRGSAPGYVPGDGLSAVGISSTECVPFLAPFLHQMSDLLTRTRLRRAFACFLPLLLTCLRPASPSNQNSTDPIHLSAGQGQVYPGDIVRIDIAAQNVERLDLAFIGRKVTVRSKANSGTWQALVGIDLETKPGLYALTGTATLPNGQSINLEKSIRILPKKFPVQRITVDEKYVTLDPEDAKRAAEESQKLGALWGTITPNKLWQGQFLYPVSSTLTSGFGRRRIVNDQPRSPHSGVDLKASTGTPIQAANVGHVVLAEDLFFSGNTVVLDHGLGLYTYYAHCSRILVTTGETVKKGQVIAEVGASGRVTGPHLHWACRLSQARVNPLALAEKWMAE
jgi:murein DD-endopeptidase MepM/ murein hydrolase activator NlpD